MADISIVQEHCLAPQQARAAAQQVADKIASENDLACTCRGHVLPFWGAAGQVTGSCHLLEWRGHRVALDAGLFQGRREESHRLNAETPFDPRQLDTVIVDTDAGTVSLWHRGHRAASTGPPPSPQLRPPRIHRRAA